MHRNLLVACLALALLGGWGCGPSGESAASSPVEVIGFGPLVGFEFPMPKQGEEADPTQIPPEVRALDGKRAQIPGSMMVLDFEKGRTTRFLLMKDQSGCCFGADVRVSEWIMVEVPPGKKVRVEKSGEIVIDGPLAVGPAYGKEGWMHSIYQMVARDVLGPDGKSLMEDA